MTLYYIILQYQGWVVQVYPNTEYVDFSDILNVSYIQVIFQIQKKKKSSFGISLTKMYKNNF